MKTQAILRTGAATFALGLVLAAAPAVAQDAGDDTTTTEGDAIVVTGSRIARPDLQSSSPVAVVSAQDVADSGSTNVEQFLNELPQVTPDATATTNNGSDGGIATINLRDLGASRTLVLVNGRRFVASNNLGWVDLNNIPAALIERVDVVTGGASAVYGSDAVAGVVNFILKDDFAGFNMGGQYRLTQRGDSANRSVDATVGANFDDGRGNAVLHMAWNKRDETRAAERERTATALGDFGDGLYPLGSSRILGGTILVPSVLPDGTVGQVKFLPDGTPVARNGETFNFQPLNFLQTPQERWLINSMAHYEISDSIEAYVEGFYGNTRAVQQLAADANDIPEPPNQLRVTIANPLYNPTLQAFLAQFDTGANATTGSADAVAGDGIATIPAFRRRMAELGPRSSEFEHDVFRALGGFRGNLTSDINYDLYYSHARTNRSEVLGNYSSDARIQDALLVESDGNGGVQCASENARSQGCVPISLFGFGALQGPGMDYISPTAIVRRSTTQDIVAGVLNGTLGSIGTSQPIGWALGAEYRREASDNLPDQIVQSGELGPGSAETVTSGMFDVTEFFGELVVPVLDFVTLEAAARYSDYSTVGGVWTYKAGGTVEPVDGVKFRALYQRAVRAPNIYELFQGTAAGADDFDDPCAARNNPNAQLQAFCIAQGVPAAQLPTFEGDPGGQATTLFGGNPNLKAEKADTWTAGVVFEPASLPGLSATVDYYRITLKDAIDDLDAATTSNLCFASLDLNSEACQAIQRDPANGIVSIITALRANLAREEREGIDWGINYRWDVGLFGGSTIAIQHIGNYTLKNRYQPLEGADYIDCRGVFGDGCTGLGDFIAPKWKANTSVLLSTDNWNWRNQLRVIGATRNNDDSDFVQGVDTQAYWDMTANWIPSENFTFTFGIDNVLDKDIILLGDSGADANTDPSLYDVFGRTFFVGARINF